MNSRLEEIVDYGFLDNRTDGEVIVTLYLKGGSQPMRFHLHGNALRDIAGSLVEFRNRDRRVPTKGFPYMIYEGEFSGTVGDLTASRKDYQGKNKRTIHNFLYLECFTHNKGMFLLESCNYDVSIKRTDWVMTPHAESAQIMQNQHVLRDHIAEWINKFKSSQEDILNPLPLHFWDMRLREAEATAIAYHEVQNKYKNDLCSEVRMAFVLGWDEMLGEFATADENGTPVASFRGVCSLMDLLNDKEAREVQTCMEHELFQEITHFSELVQTRYRDYIGMSYSQFHTPPESVIEIFSALRYITPQVLSCLLQIHEPTSKKDYRTMNKRLDHCRERMSHIMDVINQMANTTDKNSDRDQDRIEELTHSIHTIIGQIDSLRNSLV